MRKLDKNEIQGKLESFPQGFKEKFGQELNPDLLRYFLHTELNRIENDLIKEAWSNLHPESIRLALNEIEKDQNDESSHLVPKHKGAKHYKSK